MKMITNYLSNLESYLPEDMQQDVREELEASIYGQIEDLKEQLGSEPDEYDVASILQKMGHPMRVASTYLPNQQLIDSDFYPAFKDSLQKVMLVFLVIQLLNIAPELFSGDLTIRGVLSWTLDLAGSAISALGLVTFTFWLIAKYDAKACLAQIYRWSPQELKAKHSKLPLKRIDLLFDLLFHFLIIAWWNNFISIPIGDNPANIINAISMSDDWASVTLTVNFILGASILISLHKLFVAGWQKLTLVATICMDLVILGVLSEISRLDNHFIVDEVVRESAKWQKNFWMADYALWTFMALIVVIMIWDIYYCNKRLKQQ